MGIFILRQYQDPIPELIERIGFLVDRMSVNLELPTAEGLKNLAPGKTRDKILRPMRQIQRGICEQENLLEEKRINIRTYMRKKGLVFPVVLPCFCQRKKK